MFTSDRDQRRKNGSKLSLASRVDVSSLCGCQSVFTELVYETNQTSMCLLAVR